jgi:hypothetical protein
MHIVRGELNASKALAEQLVQMAQGAGDGAQLRWAHASLAGALFHRGELLLAKEHSEAAIGFYDRERRAPALYRGFTGSRGSVLQELNTVAARLP